MEQNQDYQLRSSPMFLAQTNEVLGKGSFYAAVFGFASSVALYLLEFFGITENLIFAAHWAGVCGFFALLVLVMATQKRVRGRNAYLLFLPMVSLPSLLFLLAHLALPSGAASYITGPASYLYFLLIVLTGFLFDWKLSYAAGALAGVQYFLFFWLDRESLLQISAPDPILLQDLVATPIFLFKSLMMGVTGILVGVASFSARSLIGKVLAEELERANLDRLFGQFVSKEVKDKIIAEKKEVIGEKKTVAVLFADIRSFSTLSEQQEPELVVTHLNEYLDRMVHCVTVNGGVVDKFIGDAVMAVFGGVIPLENPCGQAIQAAMLMRRELAALNATWRRKSLPVFDNGIGIHYGEVVQGTVGSRERKEFTVMGDTVNTASRLEGLTKEKGSKIIFSQPVWERLPPELKRQTRDLGGATVKGKAAELRIFGFFEHGVDGIGPGAPNGECHT